MAITVSIVEDHAATRESIAALLRRMTGVTLLGAYRSAEAALAGIPTQRPDVALVDIRLPGMSGIECVAQLKSQMRDLQILIVTTYEEQELIFDSLRAGASGYILKNTLTTELAHAIESVHAGGAPMSMPIARKVISFFHEQAQPESPEQKLTPREQEILTLLSRGYKYKEIAEKMGVGFETVKGHIKHVYDKLHVRSRTEATLRFLGVSGR